MGLLELLNAILWGPGTVGLLLGTGAWLTLRTGAFPQRMLPLALRLSLGREARRKGNNGVSPFGSLMTALASTVGTGNIVGVAAALVSGGPGALVWMELAALLGLTLKLAECMLAVKYRSRAPDGTRWGGPMAVMEARLGVIGKPMGRLYALFALLMSFSMGAMAQSGALADTFFAAFSLPRAETGLATAALALVIPSPAKEEDSNGKDFYEDQAGPSCQVLHPQVQPLQAVRPSPRLSPELRCLPYLLP